MMKLYLHDKSWPQQVDDKEKLAGLQVGYIKSVVKDLYDPKIPLKDATHAIVHDEEKMYDKYEKEDLNLSVDGQILLIVSTHEPGNKTRKHFKKIAGNKTRYVLYARYSTELKKKEVLKAFCQMNTDEAEAVYNRNISKVPKPLMRLFGLFSIDYFCALSILCQSYLMAHFDLVEHPDRNSKDPVIKALTHIGWTQQSFNNKSVVENAKKIAAATDKPQWWKDAFTDECLFKKMKDECADNKMDWNEKSSVAELCKWIDSDTDKIEEGFNTIVAETYLEMKEIIGK